MLAGLDRPSLCSNSKFVNGHKEDRHREGERDMNEKYIPSLHLHGVCQNLIRRLIHLTSSSQDQGGHRLNIAISSRASVDKWESWWSHAKPRLIECLGRSWQSRSGVVTRTTYLLYLHRITVIALWSVNLVSTYAVCRHKKEEVLFKACQLFFLLSQSSCIGWIFTLSTFNIVVLFRRFECLCSKATALALIGCNLSFYLNLHLMSQLGDRSFFAIWGQIQPYVNGIEMDDDCWWYWRLFSRSSFKSCCRRCDFVGDKQSGVPLDSAWVD